MTSKEKANQLFDKFKNEINWIEIDYNVDLYRDAKQCALIAVEEILQQFKWRPSEGSSFWEEVKNELLKL